MAIGTVQAVDIVKRNNSAGNIVVQHGFRKLRQLLTEGAGIRKPGQKIRLYEKSKTLFFFMRRRTRQDPSRERRRSSQTPTGWLAGSQWRYGSIAGQPEKHQKKEHGKDSLNSFQSSIQFHDSISPYQRQIKNRI